MGQNLINGNIKTERQTITLTKKLKLRKIACQGKTNKKSSVKEKNIDWAEHATLTECSKVQIFSQKIRDQRWFTSGIWMGITKYSTYMPIWTTVHTDPLSTHPQRHFKDIIFFVIPLRHSWTQYVILLKYSRTFNCWKAEAFTTKQSLQKMTLVLVSRAIGLWGGRFSQIFFNVKIFNPHDKSCPKTKSDA